MLSVVIPARNAEGWLSEQLEALADQEVDQGWEVILADNGSSDGTVAVFDSFSPRLPGARVVDASIVRGQAYARNVGAKSARGDLLVFLDADDIVEPGYLAAMAARLAEGALVTARLDRDALNPLAERDVSQQQIEGRVEKYLGFLPAGAGGALGVRRELFEQLGGFDVAMPPAEDIDFCWRAQLAGFEMAVAHGAVLRYRYRQTLLGLFRQAVNYGSIRPALYRRYRDLGMPRRHGLSAVRFYAGLARRAVRIRKRSDLAALIVLVGTRLGHLVGSVEYRVWYP